MCNTISKYILYLAEEGIIGLFIWSSTGVYLYSEFKKKNYNLGLSVTFPFAVFYLFIQFTDKVIYKLTSSKENIKF